MPRIILTILLLAVTLVGCAEAAPSLSPTAEDGGQTAEAAEPSLTPEVGTGTPSGEQPAELSSTPDPTSRQTMLPTEITASFSSSATSVEESDLLLRTALIPVAWSVSNRPENTNLVFEQALPDGATVNVELPRSDAWVASSGSGQVAPVMPPGGSTIQLRMRLVDLADGATLASQELSLPITRRSQWHVADPATCMAAPYAPPIGIQVGGVGRISDQVSGGRLDVYDVPAPAHQVSGSLQPGELFMVLDGPYCYEYPWPSDGTQYLRLWQVQARDRALAGWIEEYGVGIPDGLAYTVEPYANPGDSVPSASFMASPDPVSRGGTLTLAWSVPGASQVSLTRLSETGGIYLEAIGANLGPSGTLTYTIPDTYVTQIPFILIADNLTQITLTVEITCPFSTTLTGMCPHSQDQVEAAFQVFEKGFMIWRVDTDEIYVLYTDSGYPARETYQDTYVEGEVFDLGETPPAERVQPEHGFGKVWATQSAVRSRLGWALEPEVSYTATLEVHLGVWNRPNTIVLTFPDGRVVKLVGGATLGWSFVE